ncbi:hypothetical protein [Symbioplanes lichenis]|uniref:hypothetical protein n=1 Tax=Symbioplanes lichenis TaxID=1629072 RepID=UPI0027394A41|nr:hypothetical protein [Actinoplanes lichenis]
MAPGTCGLLVDADTRQLLRDGLGSYDMEIRWPAHLDDADVLHIWRSWTGHQIYQAVLEQQGAGRWTIKDLAVEQDAARYQGSLAAEPAQFEAVLAGIVNTLRDFRAGHTPYGPSPEADPLPPVWP